MSLIKLIITDILETLYQSFWPSFVCSILAMYLYLFKNYGIETDGTFKGCIKVWIKHLHTDINFRKHFLLLIVFNMILCRTLLNRNVWLNPLSNVMGGWTIWKVTQDGNLVLTTECFENVALMFPFIILLMWTMKEKILKKIQFKSIVWVNTKISFCFSLCIEFLQLFLRVGTFQLSDIFYNTLGGCLGGVCYWMWWKIKKNEKKERKNVIIVDNQ